MKNETEKVEARLDNHEGRLKVLEGRIGSYADAELAYRRAVDDLGKVRASYASDHARALSEQQAENRSMLTSAQRILGDAVRKAVEPFEEPLATVKEIRDAQLTRHARELVLAEQRTESNRKRNRWLAVIGAATGVIVAIAELVRAFH